MIWACCRAALAWARVPGATPAQVKDALRDGFGVEPSKVVQNAYEPIHYDETGKLCGAQPTLGMDVPLPVLKARIDRFIGEGGKGPYG